MPKIDPYKLTDPVLRTFFEQYATGMYCTINTAIHNALKAYGIDVNAEVASKAPVETAVAVATPAVTAASVLPGEKAEYGSITPAEDYVPAILKVLLNAPGYELKANECIKRVMALMDGKLKDIDRERLPNSPEVRAHNKINWARQFMQPHDPSKPKLPKKFCSGYFVGIDEAGRGIWKLSDVGLKAANGV